MKNSFQQLLCASSVLVLLSACGGGGGDSSTPASRQGTLKVSLTDAPACGFDQVNVTVEKVRVHSSADATGGTGEAGWSEVTLNPARKINLLDLTNGALTVLGQTPLPAGSYQQVRLILADNKTSPRANSVIATGKPEEVELATPSATQSGYKIVGGFTVAEGALVDLVLDFDACRSVLVRGNGAYQLKPVVTATTLDVAGKIEGYAPAGARISAQQNGTILRATVADASGRFVISPLVESSVQGNYDVVIVAEAKATTIVNQVPVVRSSTTNLATSSAPFAPPAATMRTVSGAVTPAASADARITAKQGIDNKTYEIASTAHDASSGAYTLKLPAAAPLVAPYANSLPLVGTANAAAAGKYQVSAANATTTKPAVAVDVTTADVGGVNFAF
jgi:hypothetical protein